MARTGGVGVGAKIVGSHAEWGTAELLQEKGAPRAIPAEPAIAPAGSSFGAAKPAGISEALSQRCLRQKGGSPQTPDRPPPGNLHAENVRQRRVSDGQRSCIAGDETIGGITFLDFDSSGCYLNLSAQACFGAVELPVTHIILLGRDDALFVLKDPDSTSGRSVLRVQTAETRGQRRVLDGAFFHRSDGMSPAELVSAWPRDFIENPAEAQP